ncbi:penicillin-binding protein activator [Reinekea sp.]|uniref:penicillin-binding protein activator n=1 Tax=Reinekea sp. TaxID=1970455 RepID=UPI002A83342D|nr:penicillin-binding protein activator [Reinekea sp.]
MRICSFVNTAIVLPLLVITVLQGCVSTPVKPPVVAPEAQVVIEPTLESDPFINQQILAIETFIAQHQIDEARIILTSLNFNQLLVDQQTRYVLANANIALILGDGQEALTWLNGEYAYLFDGLPLQEQIILNLKRAEAYEFSGRPLSAARERIFLAPVLEDETAVFNQEQIWFDLQLVPKQQLLDLANQESSPDLNGWIQLAVISMTEDDDLARLLIAIEQWQLQNSGHPGAKLLPRSLQMLNELASSLPTHLGIMLPLSGPLEKAGKAIRNGLLAAWYQARQSDQDTPELTFYDTAANEDMTALYKQASDAGAQAIIGPLAKARVQKMAEIQDLSVPVLALNYADKRIEQVANFYQFGLAPEDEAIQVANDIWQQGVRRVMIVAPASAWGERVSDAFILNWQLKGGVIASKALFKQPDQYLTTIKNGLNIQDSEQRYQLLRRKLDQDLVFEFRRREDIDMVFMLAFPAQARQLKPILNYQRGVDLPVVATSNLYSGVDDPDKNQDLEGIRFVEMPWRLAPSPIKNRVAEAFPDSLDNYAALVALGVDAYRLYPRLKQMSVFNDVRIQGVTGTMTMSDNGRIQRTLDWAEVQNGLVRRVPASDLQQ